MAGATPTILSQKTQDAIIAFHTQCYNMLQEQWNIRSMLEQIDRAYIRENDFTVANLRAKAANNAGDPNRFQNITVPVIKPQVESAVAYQAGVFLADSPVFGFVADPLNQDAALQYQAIMEQNARQGGWISELIKFFRDGFKYNLCALEVTWERQITAAIETDLSFTGGKQGKPKEVIWEGNRLKRRDLYNTFWDSRYYPTDVYKDGEFIGYTELMSRVHLKKFMAQLPDVMVSNVKAAFESGLGASGQSSIVSSYYIPQINPDALINENPIGVTTNWVAWAGLMDRPSGEIQYRDIYEVTTMYARIIPQDFDMRVPARSTPQVWKFIIVNHQIPIYAERQTNAHNFLPILLGQPNEDGLGYQTKSLATDAKPFQDVASALVNSAMAARRRAISDRTIYDPSRISEAHINSDNPSAKIPLRPAGYGKPASEAVYAFPFRDDQSAVAFQELPQVLAMADRLGGQNPIRQGQFVKGNKNNPEFQAVMAGASGQDQLRALVLEDQVLTPAREIIKINTLQFQAAGTIFSPTKKQSVAIDPVALRKAAATFITTDGLATAEKQIHTDEFTVALQTIGSSPQIAAGYNISPMFSYLMKTRNVDLKPFEKSPEQIAFEQAMQAWQMAAQESLKKGIPFNAPQPKPADYNYNPSQQLQGADPQASTGAPNPQS